MEQTRAWIIVIGLLAVVGMAGFGYWLGVRVEQRSTPDVSATPSPVPTVPPPTPTAQSAAAPPPTAVPTSSPVVVEPTITLESLPATVRRNAPLHVRWQIQGSPAVRGASTRVVVSLEGGREIVGPARGPYALPAGFEAVVIPAQSGNTLLLVEAVIEGQTFRSERRVTVE